MSSFHFISSQGYTNADNPFGDQHLLEKFVWDKVSVCVCVCVCVCVSLDVSVCVSTMHMYVCDWFVQKRDQEATEFKLTKREIEEREEKRQEEMRRELQKAIKRKAEREKEKEAREEEMVSSCCK